VASIHPPPLPRLPLNCARSVPSPPASPNSTVYFPFRLLLLLSDTINIHLGKQACCCRLENISQLPPLGLDTVASLTLDRHCGLHPGVPTDHHPATSIVAPLTTLCPRRLVALTAWHPRPSHLNGPGR
jgi:hypothetical protein